MDICFNIFKILYLKSNLFYNEINGSVVGYHPLSTHWLAIQIAKTISLTEITSWSKVLSEKSDLECILIKKEGVKVIILLENLSVFRCHNLLHNGKFDRLYLFNNESWVRY